MHRWRCLTILAVGTLGLLLAVQPAILEGQQKGKGKKKTNPVELIDPHGKPKQFDKGEVTGYAVWFTEKGWHFRTTSANKTHHYKGTVQVVGGVIEQIHSAHLEKEGKLDDHWRVGPKRHELAFDFKTKKGIDGIDFRVSNDATLIRFDLHSNGEHLPAHVWIGKKGLHPDEMPFTLVAHPAKKK